MADTSTVRLSGQLPSGLTFGLWVSADSIVVALPGNALVAARGSLTANACRELTAALAECADRMEATSA